MIGFGCDLLRMVQWLCDDIGYLTLLERTLINKGAVPFFLGGCPLFKIYYLFLVLVYHTNYYLTKEIDYDSHFCSCLG